MVPVSPVSFAIPILSFVLGFVGVVVADRLRYRVACIDAELARIDALFDEIEIILQTVRLGGDVPRANLLSVLGKRRRLGQNLARWFRSAPSWLVIKTALNNVNHIILCLEHLAFQTESVANLPADIDARCDGLRASLTSAAEKTIAWAWFRPAGHE